VRLTRNRLAQGKGTPGPPLFFEITRYIFWTGLEYGSTARKRQFLTDET